MGTTSEMGTNIQGGFEVPPRSMRQSRSQGDGKAESLATALGWFSVGLGLAQIVAPEAMTRLVGARESDDSSRLMRAFGLRELSTGIGILSNRRTDDWMRARVAGDVLDLAMLGKTMTDGENDRAKTIGATIAVLGVMALDVLAAEKLQGQRDGATARPQLRSSSRAEPRRTVVRRAITVGLPREEVYAFWRNFENLPRFMEHLESVRMTDDRRSHWTAKTMDRTIEWDAEITEDQPNELIAWRTLNGSDVEHDGRVRFVTAPGNRGTEIHVDLAYDPPGGRISAMIAKLFREAPGQQVQDDLYNLKQVLETGEITVSDATARKGPHPAQPNA